MYKSIFILSFSLFLLFSCHSKKKQSEAANEPVEEVKSVEEVKDVIPNYNLPLEIQLLHKQLSDTVFARIERTPCFGRCPIYIITIYKSGYTTYEGENFVDMIGKFETNLEQKKLEQLMTEAKRIKFFEFDPIYDNENVTDLPATLVTISTEDNFKTSINRYGGPEELRSFSDFFDSIIKGSNWEEITNEQNE